MYPIIQEQSSMHLNEDLSDFKTCYWNLTARECGVYQSNSKSTDSVAIIVYNPGNSLK